MRFLLVQLSDIHLKASDNAVLHRATKIVDAVKSLDYELSACFVVLAGDIAFGGKGDEYLVALELVDALRQRLAAELPGGVPVFIVAVPGNHDCDLVPDSSVRTALLQNIGHASNIDDPVLELCTNVQEEYFQFRNAVAADGLQPGHTRLFYEYAFAIGGRSIAFRCYNTAWMSRIPESEGTLFFPVSRVPNASTPVDLAIAVLHHPYRWFTQDNYRQFRECVQASSDIVLTGHEHIAGRYLQQSSGGEINQYIEGVALQDLQNTNSSGFNALVIDASAKRQRFYLFVWNGDMYVPIVGEAESAEPAWEELQVNRLRTRAEFEVTEPFLQFLEDPGVALQHPHRDRLRLSELFIFPDLREVKVRPGEVWPLVRGESLFARAAESRQLLITGPELCGKTALAKRVFLHLHAEGFIPLFIEGSKFRVGDDDQTLAALYRIFGEQYGAHRVEQYRQLDRSRRALIIDDVHAMRTKGAKTVDAALALFSRFAGQIFLFANDLKHQLDQLVDPGRALEGQVVTTHLRIQQFGHAKRDALVDRWFSLHPEPSDDAEFAGDILGAKHALEVVIGKNYVPAFPLFIFAILQARGAATALNLNASTYGYFYEILIKNSLAQGSNKIKFDIKTAFLTHLAWTMHVRGAFDISEEDLRGIYDAFLKRKALARPFAEMRDDLVQALILGRLGDQYWFKYKYVFYYFVASHLRDSIATMETRAEIAKLSRQLHEEDSANILLFLAHVSKDPFIVEELLRNAREVFQEYEPARIREDMEFITTPDKSRLAVEYEERDVRVSRREFLERADEEEEDEQNVAAREDETEDEIREILAEQAQWMARLSTAFKTLQILGQILKNFPGSLDAGEKEAITRECYLVGLRTLGAVTSLARENQAALIQYFVYLIRAENPAYSTRSLDHFAREEVLNKANEAMFSLVLGATYGTVQRIAYAVGSPDLELTYAAVLKEADNDAFALIDTALRLDHFAKFPLAGVMDLGKRLTGAPLGSSVLRHLVVNHFYLFPVELAIRQRVCEALDISIKRVTGRNPNIKLIAPTPDKR